MSPDEQILVLERWRDQAVFALQCFYTNAGDPTDAIGEWLTSQGFDREPDHRLLHTRGQA